MEMIKKCYSRICSLAFDMTVECKQIVRELPMSFDSLNKSSFRGLLTIDRTSKLFGLEDVLTFLHLTLQEYLAASHIASLPEIQQINMIQFHGGKNHMLTTFKFYCGLVDLQHKVHQFVEIAMGAGPDLLYTFHCAYETQESTICYRAMEIVEGQVELTEVVLTPADFTALGYVISTASLLVISVHIGFCLLYEEFIDEKWKNRELDSTDPLLYSFETTTDGFSTHVWKIQSAHIFHTTINKSLHKSGINSMNYYGKIAILEKQNIWNAQVTYLVQTVHYL